MAIHHEANLAWRRPRRSVALALALASFAPYSLKARLRDLKCLFWPGDSLRLSGPGIDLR